MNYLYILGCIIFTVYGQLIIKHRLASHPPLPGDFSEKMIAVIKLLFDPFIASGLFAAFIAALLWIVALSKFELSFAYPMMSFSFVLVSIFSFLLFNEVMSVYKILGLILIMSGIFILNLHAK